MKMIPLQKANFSVSAIGLGCEHLQGQNSDAIRDVIDAALAAGINILDVFMSEPNVRTDIGTALAGRRGDVILQGHIGAAWIDGQYCRTRDPELCRSFFEDLMDRLQTDYIDIGMLHYIDDDEDFETVFHGPVLQYALELKKKGVIRSIGMSSHNPAVALRAVKTGHLDVLMFSLNPAFDLLPPSDEIEFLFKQDTYRENDLTGTDPIRAELFKTCEAYGVGITVMKGYGAGTLLSEKSSALGVALTTSQCIHYALTRPAVVSILVGARKPEEVDAALTYLSATDEQKDYSVTLSRSTKYAARGNCMYCNHCLPCPSEIDIAQVNKFLDMATISESVPETVRSHYLLLDHKADECIACGSCERNCPFAVPVVERMEKAAALFGK